MILSGASPNENLSLFDFFLNERIMFEIHINTLGTKEPFSFRTTKFSFVITFTFNVGLANIITARKQSLRRLCFYTSLSVILFTGGGGLPQCMLGCTPLAPGTRGRHPPRTRARHPPPPGSEAGTPREQCMLGDTENKRAVRILLECILVTSFFCRLLSQWTPWVLMTEQYLQAYDNVLLRKLC